MPDARGIVSSPCASMTLSLLPRERKSKHLEKKRNPAGPGAARQVKEIPHIIHNHPRISIYQDSPYFCPNSPFSPNYRTMDRLDRNRDPILSATSKRAKLSNPFFPCFRVCFLGGFFRAQINASFILFSSVSPPCARPGQTKSSKSLST